MDSEQMKSTSVPGITMPTPANGRRSVSSVVLWLLLIMSLAMGLRYYAASQKGVVGLDEAVYLTSGRNLWRGKGFGVGPGRPLIIHPGGHGVVVAGLARLLQIDDLQEANGILFGVFGALGCAVIFLIARELYDDRTAVLAAALYGTIPVLAVEVYFWGSTTETLTILLLLVGCYGFLISYCGQRLLGAVLASSALGLGIMVRSDGIVFMFCLMAVLVTSKVLRRRWHISKTLVCVCLCVLVFSLSYSPYAIFLWRHTGRLTTNVGVATMKNFDPARLQEDGFYPEESENVAADETILGYIVQNWYSYIRRVLKNLHLILLRRVTRIIPFYLLPFIGLALFAEPSSKRHMSCLLFIGAMCVPVLVYALFDVRLRFLVVAVPGILLLAARGLALVRLRKQWVKIAIQVSIVLGLALHSVGKIAPLKERSAHPEFRAAAKWVAANSDPSDTIIARKPQVAFYADRESYWPA